jgi:hypothetical protein
MSDESHAEEMVRLTRQTGDPSEKVNELESVTLVYNRLGKEIQCFKQQMCDDEQSTADFEQQSQRRQRRAEWETRCQE